MLLDAIACAFYGINPGSYRRKSRKFNQHDLLRIVFSSVIENNNHRRLDLIVDCPAWTSFDNLKSDILSNVSRKNAFKFQTILDMYTRDQHMVKVGLENVITKVFQVFAGYSSLNLPLGTRPTTNSPRLQVSAKNSNSKRSASDCDDDANPPQYSVTLPCINGNSNEQEKLHVGCGFRMSSNMSLLNNERSLISAERTRSPVLSNTAALFTAKERNNSNLRRLFGDGNIISIAAASAEDLGLILRWRFNDYEWCFESLDSSTTAKLKSPMIIRVRGYDLLFGRFTEHL